MGYHRGRPRSERRDVAHDRRAHRSRSRRCGGNPTPAYGRRREAPAHHVHSKLMAWVALDRAVRIAQTRGSSSRRRRRWAQERDALATQIRTEGFDERLGAYTGAYGSTELDAAVLLLPVLEFEPAESPRVAGTIDAIRERLSAGGPLLHRYQPGTDGIEGGEGDVPPVLVLARTGASADRPRRRSHRSVRGARRSRPPTWALRRGVRPGVGPAPRQLPPSADPRLPRAGGPRDRRGHR